MNHRHRQSALLRTSTLTPKAAFGLILSAYFHKIFEIKQTAWAVN